MKRKKIAVIGLGYVGLPLVIEFGKVFKTIGFDLSKYKIKSYKMKCDPMFQIKKKDLESFFNCDFFCIYCVNFF